MNKKLYSFIIILIIILILSVSLSIGFFQKWNLRLTDTLYSEKTPLSNIIILSIDDKSIQALGRFPWDRKVFADLFNKLSLKQPAVVGIDVVFSEPSNKESDKALASSLEKINAVIPVEFIKFKKENG